MASDIPNADLINSIWKMKVADLRRELRQRGLPVSGVKRVLQERLGEALLVSTEEETVVSATESATEEEETAESESEEEEEEEETTESVADSTAYVPFVVSPKNAATADSEEPSVGDDKSEKEDVDPSSQQEEEVSVAKIENNEFEATQSEPTKEDFATTRTVIEDITTTPLEPGGDFIPSPTAAMLPSNRSPEETAFESEEQGDHKPDLDSEPQLVEEKEPEENIETVVKPAQGDNRTPKLTRDQPDETTPEPEIEEATTARKEETPAPAPEVVEEKADEAIISPLSCMGSPFNFPSPSANTPNDNPRSGDNQNHQYETPSTIASLPCLPPQSGLKKHVKELNHLLCSPLVKHLGDLAKATTPGSVGSNTDDMMSQELNGLSQLESELRLELEKCTEAEAQEAVEHNTPKTERGIQPAVEELTFLSGGSANSSVEQDSPSIEVDAATTEPIVAVDGEKEDKADVVLGVVQSPEQKTSRFANPYAKSSSEPDNADLADKANNNSTSISRQEFDMSDTNLVAKSTNGSSNGNETEKPPIEANSDSSPIPAQEASTIEGETPAPEADAAANPIPAVDASSIVHKKPALEGDSAVLPIPLEGISSNGTKAPTTEADVGACTIPFQGASSNGAAVIDQTVNEVAATLEIDAVAAMSVEDSMSSNHPKSLGNVEETTNRDSCTITLKTEEPTEESLLTLQPETKHPSLDTENPNKMEEDTDCTSPQDEVIINNETTKIVPNDIIPSKNGSGTINESNLGVVPPENPTTTAKETSTVPMVATTRVSQSNSTINDSDLGKVPDNPTTTTAKKNPTVTPATTTISHNQPIPITTTFKAETISSKVNTAPCAGAQKYSGKLKPSGIPKPALKSKSFAKPSGIPRLARKEVAKSESVQSNTVKSSGAKTPNKKNSTLHPVSKLVLGDRTNGSKKTRPATSRLAVAKKQSATKQIGVSTTSVNRIRKPITPSKPVLGDRTNGRKPLPRMRRPTVANKRTPSKQFCVPTTATESRIGTYDRKIVHWTERPPTPAEPHAKTHNRHLYQWCQKCRLWSMEHGTKQHSYFFAAKRMAGQSIQQHPFYLS